MERWLFVGVMLCTVGFTLWLGWRATRRAVIQGDRRLAIFMGGQWLLDIGAAVLGVLLGIRVVVLPWQAVVIPFVVVGIILLGIGWPYVRARYGEGV